MITTILLVLGGIIISVIVGTFWYSPATPMGKLHMRHIGFDKLTPEEQAKKMEEGKSMMPKLYGGQMLLSALVSVSVVYVVQLSMKNGLPATQAITFPLFNWLGYMVPAIGTGILWGNVDRAIAWKKFFSDSAFFLVTVLLTAVMTSFFA